MVLSRAFQKQEHRKKERKDRKRQETKTKGGKKDCGGGDNNFSPQQLKLLSCGVNEESPFNHIHTFFQVHLAQNACIRRSLFQRAERSCSFDE